MKFTTEKAEKAADEYAKGEKTIEEICEMVGISKPTWYYWKEKKSYFSNLLKEAEEYRNSKRHDMALNGLEQKLQGIEYTEVTYKQKIHPDTGEIVELKEVRHKYKPPSNTMIIFVLTNLDDRFEHRRTLQHEGGDKPIDHRNLNIDLNKLSADELKDMKQLMDKARTERDELPENMDNQG